MNSIFTVLLLTCIVLAFADPWDDYKQKYGKKIYDDDEDNRRYSKYNKLLELITTFTNLFLKTLRIQ